MCGIAGEVDFDARARTDAVYGMSLALAHRGPDAEGSFVSPDGNAAFGFRRLSILDLTTGDQPVANEDGSMTSMFNGEMYNHRSLRHQLEDRGHSFRSDHADGEVIVHGYEEWGDEVVLRLRGMFSLAVWDGQRKRLLLARDRLGEKPLYYRVEGRRIRFASELAALESGADLVDSDALMQFLTYQYVAAPATILAGVKKLQAGERLTFDASGMMLSRYWRVELPASRGARESEAVTRLIEESVALRCAADVPVGSFLSGGVDSAVVTALLARAFPPSRSHVLDGFG